MHIIFQKLGKLILQILGKSVKQQQKVKKQDINPFKDLDEATQWLINGAEYEKKQEVNENYQKNLIGMRFILMRELVEEKVLKLE